jgi:hypothetical protein
LNQVRSQKFLKGRREQRRRDREEENREEETKSIKGMGRSAH